MSDTYTVERTTRIDAPAEEIYPHLVNFRKWAAWSPWEDMDPSMEKTFSGAESGIGAHYGWSGNRKVGEGSMEITDAKENARIDIALEFLKPFKASNDTTLSLVAVDGGTDVTWTMRGKNTLMIRIMGIFRSMDKMVGPDFERGLARLKSVVESS